MRRADYLLNGHARRKYITVAGKHRGRRYELTEGGALRAQQIVQQLLASAPAPQPSAAARKRSKIRKGARP
jgi:hypothetical protein